MLAVMFGFVPGHWKDGRVNGEEEEAKGEEGRVKEGGGKG